jgi:hypothetical protein
LHSLLSVRDSVKTDCLLVNSISQLGLQPQAKYSGVRITLLKNFVNIAIFIIIIVCLILNIQAKNGKTVLYLLKTASLGFLVTML